MKVASIVFTEKIYIRIGELCEDETRKKSLLDYGSTFIKPSPYKRGETAKIMGGKKGLLLNSIELHRCTLETPIIYPNHSNYDITDIMGSLHCFQTRLS